MVPSVEVPGPKSNSDDPALSERNRRTIGGWFRSMTAKRSRNRAPAPRQVPSEPQSGISSQTKATPPKEKPSTMASGKRQKVSVPSSVDTGHGYMITRLSGQLEGPLSDQRLVYASCPFMDTIAYRASQKKKPAKTTSHSEADSTNVQAETKPESPGVQSNVEASVHFVRCADRPHNNSCSQPNTPRPLRAQKVVPPMFPAK